MGGGNVVSAVLESSFDAIAALAHSGVGETDGVEMVLVGFDAGDVDFYLDYVGIDSIDSGTERFVEHLEVPRYCGGTLRAGDPGMKIADGETGGGDHYHVDR